MTVPRGSSLSSALVLAAIVVAIAAPSSACTSGTTPTCDDAGSCELTADATALGDGSSSSSSGGDDGGGDDGGGTE